jgi:hypothetical protein
MGRMEQPKYGLPLDTILSLIREAEERGLEPPGYPPAITRGVPT